MSIKTIATGRLGKDPEIKTTRNNKAYCKFSLACKSGWDKEKKEPKTEWINCTAFAKIGENISKHLKKGDMLYIEGTPETTSYDKDGVKTYYTSVLVWECEFMPRGKQSSGSSDQNEPVEGEEPPF